MYPLLSFLAPVHSAATNEAEIMMHFPRTDAIYANIINHQMMDAVRLGWIPLNTHQGTHREGWSVHAMWINCACGRAMRMPK